MNRLICAIYTMYCYVILTLLIVIFSLPSCILLIIPGRYRHSRPVYYCVHLFYWLLQKLSLLSITYNGLENISGQPVIFVANHQSALDIPLLGLLAGTMPHIWLAKQEVLHKFWVLRSILPRIAVIVDTSTPRRGMLSLLKIISLAKDQARHVMIFPEGGRFTDGAVQDFYGGFVVLVRRLGRPVIPVYIQGVQAIYPPDSWWVCPGPITVTVGAPMFPHEDEDDAAFKVRVHEWFVAHTR
jgi:1-acyl-sn-glycerol-3-phosphate acyltransferase